LRAAFATPTRTPTAALAVERATHVADELVDRHAAQLERVVQRAQLEADAQAARRDVESLQRGSQDLEQQLAAAAEAWHELWRPTGLVPLAPREMVEWSERRRALLQRAVDARAAARAKVDEASERRVLRASEHDAARETEAKAQAVWIVWATAQALDPAAGATAARRHLHARAELRAAEDEVERCARALSQALALLSALSADTAVECDRLHIEVDERDIDAALAAEGRDVALTEARLHALRKAVDDARLAEARLSELERQLTLADETAELVSGRVAELERVLGAAAERHDLASIADCVTRAQCSERARALDEELRRASLEFEEHAEGRTAEEVLAQAAERTPQELAAEARERDARIEALQADVHTDAEAVGRLASVVEGTGSDEGALHEARLAELESELEDSSRDYVRLRIARHILDREVDRYRREAQGPLLARAQELFGLLTLGAFTQLHPSEDRGKTVMVARRPDGQTVRIEGMSTGTRDELYLALRIASVEHTLRLSEPMPFIADDLFVNFDDERTEAALRVLMQLGEHTQVIVFSHHLHVVEIAERLRAEGLSVEVLRLASERERTSPDRRHGRAGGVNLDANF
jgi:uncharacterized protein YhaN